MTHMCDTRPRWVKAVLWINLIYQWLASHCAWRRGSSEQYHVFSLGLLIDKRDILTWLESCLLWHKRLVVFRQYSILFSATGSNVTLTHLLVPHICVSESGQHWFRLWLCAETSIQAIIWTSGVLLSIVLLGDKLQWNFNQNTKLIINQKCIWKYHLRKRGHFVQGRWVNMRSQHAALEELSSELDLITPMVFYNVRLCLINNEALLTMLTKREWNTNIILNSKSTPYIWTPSRTFNTLRLKQNGCHFAGDILDTFCRIKIV